MTAKQSQGRKENGAMPAGRPDASTPESDVVKNGRKSARAAGPDGPDAKEIGDTFKRQP